MNLMVAINEMKSQIDKLTYEKAEVITNLIHAFHSLTKYCLIYEYIPNELLGTEFVKYKEKYYFSNNKVNIIAGLRSILEIIEEEEKKYNSKIEELEQGLKVIKGMNTTCEKCSGSGKVKRPRANSYCEIEMMTCPVCHGSGKKVG